MVNKIDFIAAAIHDVQDTIRASDFKVGALLTGMLIPASSIGKIWTHFTLFSKQIPLWLCIIIGVLFFVLWVSIIFVLIRTISAIDNPSNHIINSGEFKGSFYGGGLYKFNPIDAFVNRDVIKASKDVQHFTMDYPEHEDEIIAELTFEHLKLIYIRDAKIYRLNCSIKFASLWLSIGMFVYFYTKIG